MLIFFVFFYRRGEVANHRIRGMRINQAPDRLRIQAKPGPIMMDILLFSVKIKSPSIVCALDLFLCIFFLGLKSEPSLFAVYGYFYHSIECSTSLLCE